MVLTHVIKHFFNVIRLLLYSVLQLEICKEPSVGIIAHRLSQFRIIENLNNGIRKR